jgi:hypothetical protein
MSRPKAPRIDIENPQNYIENCIKPEFENAEKELMKKNGYYNLQNNYFVYYGERVPYLCMASKFYAPCMNQEPMLLNSLQNQLETRMKSPTEQCFRNLVDEMKRRGYEVREGELNTSVEINEDDITIRIEKTLATKFEGQSTGYSVFDVKINSPLYKMADTARNIVNFESTFCEFNNVKWMLFYPEIEVRKFVASDSTKVYTMTYRDTNKSMSFAVKTCVLPAGL